MPFKSATTRSEHPVRIAFKPDFGPSRNRFGLLTGLGFAASMLLSAAAQAATAPVLGTSATFGVLASTYSNTTAGTTINGNLGYTTGPAVAPTVSGTTFVADGTYNQAGIDQNAALATVNSQACTSIGGGAVALNTIDNGSGPGVYTPGCYSSGGAMDITTGTTVTLNGPGVYIFRPAGAFTSGANSRVVVAGGACATDVFLAPTAAATFGANSTFVGTIFGAAGATIGSAANITGRILAFGATVSTNADAITVPTPCLAPVLPRITLTKVSNGGVGTFGFSGSNGFANQSITTLTSGTGVAGATQTLTAAGVSTTITDSAPPAGYTLASISCSGLGAGGAQTPNIGARSVTLDAAATAAGAAIACTFTNTFAGATLPTITLTKVSNGGIGSFSFSGSNGFANQSITTLTAGTGVAGAAQTLTAAGVSTTITEAAPPAGYTLASISCTGLGAGGAQTPNIGTRSVTLDAAATAAGAAIACTFTNTFAGATLPTITLTKVSNGGVGTFGFSGSNGFANQSITTLTSGTGVAGATQTLTAAGVSTTITEAAPPAGYTLASISCTGLGAGGAQTNDLTARTVTLDAAATAAGAAIACTFTNNLAGVLPPVAGIPTLSEWAMILLAGLMAIAGFAAIRRKGM